MQQWIRSFPLDLLGVFIADDTDDTTLKHSRQDPEVAAFLLLRYAMPCLLDTPQVPSQTVALSSESFKL
jgi:hypothetical protein